MRSRWIHNVPAEDVDKFTNYFFAFILILLSVLKSDAADHTWILIALLLSFLFSLTAFFLNWLTLRALFAATTLGTLTLGLGGWVPALLVVIFFCSSSLISRSGAEASGPVPRAPAASTMGLSTPSGTRVSTEVAGPRPPSGTRVATEEGASAPKGGLSYSSDASSEGTVRRDGYQIWANGFWVVVVVIFWFITQSDELSVVVAAVVASVTADTWATEIGSLRPRKTVLLTDFSRVQSGDEGGVSLVGTAAGVLGALLIAVCHALLTSHVSMVTVMIILAGGVTGFLTDSLLGGLYHQKRGLWRGDSRLNSVQSFPQTPEMVNHAINWLSSGVGMGIALLLIQLT